MALAAVASSGSSGGSPSSGGGGLGSDRVMSLREGESKLAQKEMHEAKLAAFDLGWCSCTACREQRAGLNAAAAEKSRRARLDAAKWKKKQAEAEAVAVREGQKVFNTQMQRVHKELLVRLRPLEVPEPEPEPDSELLEPTPAQLPRARSVTPDLVTPVKVPRPMSTPVRAHIERVTDT